MPSIFSNLSRNLASTNVFALAQSVIISGWHAFTIPHLQWRRQGWARDLGWDPGLSTGILKHSLSPRTPGAPSLLLFVQELLLSPTGVCSLHLARNQRPDPPLRLPVVPERQDDAERKPGEKVWEILSWDVRSGWLINSSQPPQL